MGLVRPRHIIPAFEALWWFAILPFGVRLLYVIVVCMKHNTASLYRAWEDCTHHKHRPPGHLSWWLARLYSSRKTPLRPCPWGTFAAVGEAYEVDMIMAVIVVAGDSTLEGHRHIG